MEISDYGESLAGTLGEITLSPPEGTALHRVAGEAHEMADAYESDGRAFLSAGDPMNALAAFTYASGWLDASSTLGLFTTSSMLGIPEFSGEASSMDLLRLRGKTERYRKMLSGALEALECSPDQGSPLFRRRCSSSAGQGTSSVRGISMPGRGRMRMPWPATAMATAGSMQG